MGNDDSLIHCQVLSILRLLKRDTTRLTKYFGDENTHKQFISQFDNLSKLLLKYHSGSAIDIIGLENLLEPFLALLQSDDAHGNVVESAIDTLKLFFIQRNMLELVREDTRRILLYRRIIQVITQCRFEPSDPGHDEVVLGKNAALILSLFRKTEYSSLLTDMEVSLVLESILALVFLPRFSDHLKLASEQVLMELVRIVMKRFDQLKEADTLKQINFDSLGKKDEVALTPAVNPSRSPSILEGSSASSTTPYGKTCLISFLIYLTKLLAQPEHRKHKDRIKLSTLYILEGILTEHYESFLKDKNFSDFIENSLWRNVLLLNLQADRTTVFHDTLSFLSLLCLLFRIQFPSQFEFTLRNLISSLNKLMTIHAGTGHKTQQPKDNTRIEMILEFVLTLSRDSSLMGDLYRLYECNDSFIFNLQDFIATICQLVIIFALILFCRQNGVRNLTSRASFWQLKLLRH